MAGLTTRGTLPNSFDKTIQKIFLNQYTSMPEQYTKYMKIETAPAGQDFTESEMAGFSDLVETPSGAGTTFLDPVEGNKKTITYKKFTGGFQVVEEAWEDELLGKIKMLPKMLGKAAAHKKETASADLLNNGFSTTYHTSRDGLAIFSDSHTALGTGDSIDNNETAVLSATSFKAAQEYFMDLVDNEGMPMSMSPGTLMVPVGLHWMAENLKQAGLITGYADNDINAVNPDYDAVPEWKWMVNNYLTSSTAWFLFAKEIDFRFYWKNKVKMTSWDDPNTGNRMYKVMMRFKTFCGDFRPIYGSSGA